MTVVGLLDTVRKELTFDIGFGDVITPSPVYMIYPTIIEEMESPRITAYSLETVIAEKFQTMVEKSVFNSRMKDFFDLYRIIGINSFD
ncbi:MAG: nucleotidyl transferase AbiEii/AbiGii toxin family protein [Muribaculaceae bacterium]|nr:nucleotidyl transferase AbiEii/AbiGii toxin family protein [Muribaculaceae bacterium]